MEGKEKAQEFCVEARDSEAPKRVSIKIWSDGAIPDFRSRFYDHQKLVTICGFRLLLMPSIKPSISISVEVPIIPIHFHNAFQMFSPIRDSCARPNSWVGVNLEKCHIFSLFMEIVRKAGEIPCFFPPRGLAREYSGIDSLFEAMLLTVKMLEPCAG